MDQGTKAFEVTRSGDVDIVRLIEPKVAQTALETLQKDLAKRIAGGTRKMVIDLAPVAFVDSFGIGVIAATSRLLEQAGGTIVLCGVGERVMMSLTITRLDRSLTIVADEAAALRSLGGQG